MEQECSEADKKEGSPQLTDSHFKHKVRIPKHSTPSRRPKTPPTTTLTPRRSARLLAKKLKDNQETVNKDPSTKKLKESCSSKKTEDSPSKSSPVTKKTEPKEDKTEEDTFSVARKRRRSKSLPAGQVKESPFAKQIKVSSSSIVEEESLVLTGNKTPLTTVEKDSITQTKNPPTFGNEVTPLVERKRKRRSTSDEYRVKHRSAKKRNIEKCPPSLGSSLSTSSEGEVANIQPLSIGESEITVIKSKGKTRKRKPVEQVPADFEYILKNKTAITDLSVNKEEERIIKGKGRKKRKKDKGRRRKHSNNCAIHKSVIQYTMSSKDKDNQPGPSGEGGGKDPSGDQATGSSSGLEFSEPIDPFMSLMNEESKRLQMMLESRGLPPHLLGSLGPRMPHLFSKHLSSSNNSRAQQLLEGLQCIDDESVELQSCIEIGQLLVMGNEETLSGFPVKETVPALIHLLSMEHNFDMMMNACRALTYMMEALPRSTVIVSDAIPVLLEKLQVIQCMDVAEQALSALEILSRKHSKAILQTGGVNACLLYLDFFSLTTQRSALSVAANSCLSVSEEEYPLVSDSIPILSNRLQHQDKKSVESCCLCFSRLVDNFANNSKILQEIASQGLLPNIQNLLVMSPPVVSAGMFITVVRMLSTLCAVSPVMAVELLKLNIAETLKYLLIGSEEITLENIEIHSRSSNEVFEIVSLISELMPPLPKDGIFEIDKLLMTNRRPTRTTIQWEWQADSGSWQPYNRVENRLIEASHLSGEDDVSVDVLGRTYIIEFSVMQQINEETGNTRSIRRSVVDANAGKDDNERSGKKDIEDDPRGLTLCAETELCASFMQSLFAVLFEEFSNMAAPSVKYKCLKAIMRMLNCATAEVLTDVLRDISVSSYIATMLKSQDYRIVVTAIQMANILILKLPEIFLVYFHREGVMHALELLKSLPLKAINTPKKPEPHKPSSSVIYTPLVPSFHMSVPHPHPHPHIHSATPTTTESVVTTTSSDSPSTGRRFADIFRKSRRQLRKSFTKSRSDDVLEPPPPLSMGGRTLPSVPILPTTATLATHPHNPLVLTREEIKVDEPVPIVTEDQGLTTKQKIRDWIQNQATSFLEKWSVEYSSSDKNPALEVMRTLKKTVDNMDPSSTGCLNAINELCTLLSDSTTSVSAFEFIHCEAPQKLYRILSEDNPQLAVPLTVRLRYFLHVFMGLPEQDAELSSWIPQEKPGILLLLQKLHGCISQTENFPVRVYDMPGRRGTQAMKFFNSHQIKCNLELHPSASATQTYKGGIVRIDPLATMQAIERYLIIRGATRLEQKSSDDTEGSDESESDEPMLTNISLGPTKRQLEFLINDRVVPHNMTVFQAIKQFEHNVSDDSEEELSSLGHPVIWIRSHTIHYRPISQGESPILGLKPKRSYSLPGTPIAGLYSTNPPKKSQSGSAGTSATKTRRNLVSTRLSTPARGVAREGVRVTRSMSREQQEKKELKEKEEDKMETTPTEESTNVSPPKLSPLLQAIKQTKIQNFSMDDLSIPIINLLRILYALNNHWNDLYNGFPGNATVSQSEFVSVKLTAKATRQLQDPLNVMTGNFPDWLRELAKQCPFLFPFEYRQTFFYLTAFDRDRAIMRLQEQQPETNESSERVAPKLEKKKRCVSRDGLLQQAERIMDEMSSSRALLEVQYEDEVGTGLGPTLEFYTLVSRELQQADLHMWRGDPCPLPGSSSQASNTTSVTQYINSPVGLFPAPLAADTSFTVVEEICKKFRFLGCFIAKAIMDSRMLDLPLSEAFYKWMLGQESSFTAQDLLHVDPVMARSFAQLADVAVKKHQLDCEPLLTGKALQVGIESLTLEGGGSVEDLDLDFTLPGYPYIELKPHGRDIPVTIYNLDEYLKLVLDWTLVTGVSRQIDAFREGFNHVFSLTSMQQFYSHEMDMFLCGANNQKWDIKELVEHCRPDHGYTHDSQAVQFLFQVLSSYNTTEQRQFIQFVTGSPRLPVGGFKALNPPLTIVRKTVETSQYPDHFLPSVMTCVNYLKLPDYSSKEVMKEKLNIALQEGKQSFHLS